MNCIGPSTMIINLKNVFIFRFEMTYAILLPKAPTLCLYIYFGPSFINHLVFKNCRITSLLRHVPSGNLHPAAISIDVSKNGKMIFGPSTKNIIFLYASKLTVMKI